MKSYPTRDFAPWLLLPGIVLTLGSVTLLAPHEAASAAPPVSAQAAPKTPVSDDGDGDELLEHWGDPTYSREARLQLGGIAAGFLVLAAASASRRARRRNACEVVPLPSKRDFLKQDHLKQDHLKQDHLKQDCLKRDCLKQDCLKRDCLKRDSSADANFRKAA